MMQLKAIDDRSVLYVMATQAEYGRCLAERIEPLMCGVGPVEAAVSLSACLARLESELPDLVVSLGSAGSARLPQAEIFQVSHVAYRDMDASAFGFEKGVTPFLDQPAILPLAPVIPGLKQASLATGASVVSGAGYDVLNADMVDMETYALVRACQTFDVPLIGLRGISDGAEEVSRYEDWTRYLEDIDRKLAETVDRLEDCLRNDTLQLPG